MLHVRLDHAISKLVSSLLPRGGSKLDELPNWERSLYVRVRFSASVYPHGFEPLEKTRYAHFVFSRPKNFMKVFFADSDDHQRPDEERFFCTCYHDSCWRDSGFTELGKFQTSVEQSLSALGVSALGNQVSRYVCIDEIEFVNIRTSSVGPKRWRVDQFAALGKRL